jgi:putative Holliday junction resolvase
MRTIGIDLGTKRIGVAISDQGGKLAMPLEVISVSDPQQAIAPLLELIREEGVERVVLGLPLNMDESLGPAARSVIAWSKAFSSQSGLSVIFVDERLSSFAAEEQLAQRRRAGEKLTRKRKKEQLDAVAAAGFLQAFLDGKLLPIDVR